MPEGDTIARAARSLETALAGRRVAGFESGLPGLLARGPELVGRRVRAVGSLGKHLLVRFEGGLALHTHLGMRGSWRIEPARSRTRRALAGVRLDMGDLVAVCRRPLVAELLSEAELRRHPRLGALGPDAARDSFDAAEARRRLRARAEREIGVALLDQRVLAGVGNVYKSELLFRAGLDPFARVGALADATLDALVRDAALLIRANLATSGRRTTTSLEAGPLAVYGRAGRPCPRCGRAIVRRAQGERPRSTYFCPRCQPPVAG